MDGAYKPPRRAPASAKQTCFRSVADLASTCLDPLPESAHALRMATLKQKIAAEQKVRELLQRSDVQYADEIEYGNTCIRFVWLKPRLVLVVDIDEPADDLDGLEWDGAPGSLDAVGWTGSSESVDAVEWAQLPECFDARGREWSPRGSGAEDWDGSSEDPGAS